MPRKRRRNVKRDANQSEAFETVQREEAERDLQLLELEQPKFLSLVTSPANREPFHIVRSAGKVKRIRRDSVSALLSLSLPADVSDDDLAEVMRQFGITDDEYEVERGQYGTYIKKKKRDDDAEPVEMQIAPGVKAEIDSAAIYRSQNLTPKDRPSLAVVKYHFCKDWERKQCEDYLSEIGVEYEKEDLFAIAGQHTLVRFDIEENVETKIIKLSEEVSCEIAHTEKDDIPRTIYRQIIEEAYGNYGWGHVDFFQTMADEMFTQDMNRAMGSLYEVMDTIIFRSQLPLSDRVSLVENAAGEFVAWVSALMMSLPRDAMSSEGNIDLASQTASDVAEENNDEGEAQTTTETKETADMPNTDEAKHESKTEDAIQRSDAETSIEEEAQATAESEEGQEDVTRDEENVDESEGGDDSITLSRTELDALVQGAVSTALEQASADVSRSDEVVEEETPEDPMVSAISTALSNAVAPLIQRLDKIEEAQSGVVVRSDVDDDDSEEEHESVLRSDDDDWARGSLFGRNAEKLYGSKAKRG